MSIAKAPRILFVDDDAKFVDSVRRHLEAIPAQTVVASTGDEAVELLLEADLKADPFKLIIQDMWVPRSKDDQVDAKFGEYFLLDIQKTFGLVADDTPTIVFTAHESYENCVQCIWRGAVDYLPKTPPLKMNHVGPVEYPPPEEPKMVNELIKRCRELLFHNEPQKTALDRLVETHGHAITNRFRGKYVGCVPAEVYKELQAKTEHLGAGQHIEGEELGDNFIVVGDTWQAVRLMILKNKLLRWKDIEITHVSLLEAP